MAIFNLVEQHDGTIYTIPFNDTGTYSNRGYCRTYIDCIPGSRSLYGDRWCFQVTINGKVLKEFALKPDG